MADGTIDIDVKVGSAEAQKRIGDLEKSAERLSAVGSKAATAAKVGLATAGAALVAMSKAALDAYAEYEQLVGGVETLFGASAGEVQAYAARAYKTAGMSANAYMETVTGFSATLLQGLAGDTAAAAKAADMAVTDMADNANKMGTPIESIREAYQGFAKDNYTMLDNLKLGYGGTQAEMARLINDSGVLGESMKVTAQTVGDVPFDKMIEAIHRVQEEMGIAGTTSMEAATTIQGSVSSMQAAWENWLAGLGNEGADMSALTQQLLDSVSTVAANVAPRVAQIGAAIVAALPGALSGLGAAIAPIVSEALASAWSVAVSALSGLGIQLPPVDASQIAQAFGQLQQAFSDFAETAGPVIAPVVQAVVDLVSTVVTNLPTILPIVQSIAAGFLAFQGISAVVGIVATVTAAVGPLATVIGMVVSSIAAGAPVIATLGAAFGLVVSPATLIIAAIAAVVAAIVALATNAGGCRDMVVGAFTAVAEFIAGLPGAIGGFLSQLISDVQAWASSMASQAVAAGSTFISNVGSFIQQLPSNVWNWLMDVLTKAGQFAGDFGTKAVAAASSFAESLISGLAAIPGKVVQIGSDIIGGLVEGVTGAAQGLIDAVGGAVSGALDWAKNLLGIHSPSKVFRREVGRWIPLGAAVGIEDEEDAPQRALDRALDLDADVRVERSIALGAAAGEQRRIEQTVNFYQRAETPDELARTMRAYANYGLCGVV